jgi:hypothetical protein
MREQALHRVAARPPEAVSLRRGPNAVGVSMDEGEELLRRTLAFSSTDVSDDGTVTIRRLEAAAVAYPGDRFVGHCSVCSRGHPAPTTGEPLTDIREASRFMSMHRHGDVD